MDVVEEFNQEIERMNLLEPRLRSKSQGLLAPHNQRKLKVRQGHLDLRMSKKGVTYAPKTWIN